MKRRNRRRPPNRQLPKPTAPTGPSWLDELLDDLDRRQNDPPPASRSPEALDVG